jgi:hypothetical protein
MLLMSSPTPSSPSCVRQRGGLISRFPQQGSRRRASAMLLVALWGWLCAAGCHRLPLGQFALPQMGINPVTVLPLEVPVANPSYIPATDPDFLWNQIVDSVDDYFRIDDEQPVRRSANNWFDGRLVTYPEISGTNLEPWRRDAARGFERLQSTFQTIRRTATVRVIPKESGYAIEVQVLKEQEDVDQSQFATAGSASQRHDGTVVRNENQLRQMPVTLGWYEVGRDRELEQRIMADILGRVTQVAPPRKKRLN